jgi:hypothetical protein
VLAAAVKHVASSLSRQRVTQELARARTAGHHHRLGGLEVLAGLLLGPRLATRREPLQSQRGAAGVARHAAGVIQPFLEKQRLNAGFVKIVVEGWRGGLGRGGLLRE